MEYRLEIFPFARVSVKPLVSIPMAESADERHELTCSKAILLPTREACNVPELGRAVHYCEKPRRVANPLAANVDQP